MKISDGQIGGKKKTYFKLKDGDSTFRIIPPVGDLAATKGNPGVWNKYYKVHYGYKNTKNRMVTFQSPLVQDFKSKMVSVPDKALERIDRLKAELLKAKEANNAPMVEKLNKLVGAAKAMYNLDKKYYMNAIDTQGNIGILKIGYKAFKALEQVIEKLNKVGTNPISVDNGRFFTFTRSGTGRDTVTSVAVHKKVMTVDGIGEVEQDVVHKLTPEILDRIEQEALVSINGEGKSLNNLFPKFTAAQVEEIVNKSDMLTGVSPVLDNIFENESSLPEDDGGDDEGYDEETVSKSAKPDTKATTKTAAAPQVQQTVATQQASPIPSEKPVQKAAEKAVAPANPSTQTTAQSVAEISDDDFLATLNMN